ncbi:hypothetical protein TNCV_3682711 [Trichonephila clavipes]|uniref:Uncharacterized protein n=1 Tax=Trichonephila clavipes TaxID=2585209 RepID=A0A8X6RBN4_TRICX|nr:hypothetical protein TNCV_3682711 [Trichonephila clavipes]
MFQSLRRQLWENGSFIASADGRGRSRTVRQTPPGEVILGQVDETPGTSTRQYVVYMSVNQPFGELNCCTVGECNF